MGMNYDYGKLVESVQKVEYEGVETPTTIVSVDPHRNLIAVDVKKLSPSILWPSVNIHADGKYVLLAYVDNTITKYKWITIEEANDFIQKQIDGLQAQILSIEANESLYRDKIALDIDRIEKEIIKEEEARINEDNALHDELNGFELNQGLFNEKVTIFMNTTDGTLKQLYDTLNQEIEDRKYEDTQLSTRIETSFNTLQDEIDNLDSVGSTLREDLTKETEERKEADSKIGDTITEMIERDACHVSVEINEDYTVTVSIYNRDKELLDSGTISIPLASVIIKAEYDETTKSIILYLADGSILTIPVGDILSGLAKQGAIDKEIYDREQADETLQNNIDTEANRRSTADQKLLSTINSSVSSLNEEDELLQSLIDQEIENREREDNTLQSNIEEESSIRSQADEHLESLISQEAETRETNDSTLQSNIEEEASIREQEDITLQSNIDDTNVNLEGESNERREADEILQSNIDATNKALEEETQSRYEENATDIKVTLDPSTYILTVELLAKDEKQLAIRQVDFPLESLILDVSYDSTTKSLIVILKNGEERYIPLGDLIDGLVSTSTFDSTVDSLKGRLDVLSESLEAETTARSEQDTLLSGLITSEVTARSEADSDLRSLIQDINNSVSSQISILEKDINEGIATAVNSATQASESAKEAQESANEAKESSEEAVTRVGEMEDDVNDLKENKTSIKVREEVDDEEIEEVYTSIPELYFDGEIERDEEGSIEKVIIVLDCGGAK